MDKQVTAKARVRLTVDVAANSSWGNRSDIAQVHHQAAREAVSNVKRVLADRDVKVIGEPEVEFVTVSQD